MRHYVQPPRLTEPTTAYDLLSRICEVILEEPLRFNMSAWGQNNVEYYADALKYYDVPACGTIGCVAGWAVQLVNGRINGIITPIAAREILGLSPEQGTELFTPDEEIRKVLWRTAPTGTESDHQAHAQAGVEHIRAFQQKYEQQLKHTPVEPRNA